MTSTIIEPGVVGLVNLGSTCYINSSVQCLNSFATFRNALLQDLNTSALAIPVLAPYGTTNRTRGKSAKERPAGGEGSGDECEEEGEKEEQVAEESSQEGKGKGKKGKGKAKENDGEGDKSEGEKEKAEGDVNIETTVKGKITDANPQAAATRVHDYVATFKAVLYHIWHSSRGVDRAVLHGLRLASGYALDFKYFRNQHQDINEYLMHALVYPLPSPFSSSLVLIFLGRSTFTLMTTACLPPLLPHLHPHPHPHLLPRQLPPLLIPHPTNIMTTIMTTTITTITIMTITIMTITMTRVRARAKTKPKRRKRTRAKTKTKMKTRTKTRR